MYPSLLTQADIVLELLAVHPQSQGKGAGTALVRAGLEEAKSHNVPAWLEASAAGYNVYRKCGFRDVGEPIDMDLRQYGSEGRVRTVCMLFGLLD